MGGKFITFEGGEGAGKSSQIIRLAKRLRASGYDVLVTREPGGSPGAEAIRHVLLSGSAEHFGPDMEAVLFAAARSDNVENVIKPALADGKIVLCDRFMDSSRVYQGITGGVDEDFVLQMERAVTEGARPGLTLIFDISPEDGLARAAQAWGDEGPDRFEREDMDMHRMRREGFLKIAQEEPNRCVVINAALDFDVVSQTVDALVDGFLQEADERAAEAQALA